MKQLPVSLIITVRGHEPLLHKTIAIARNEAGREFELVLVFDGSPHPAYDVKVDDLGEILMGGFDADKVLVLREPRGCMAARHAGICKSTGRIIAVTDAHVRLPPGWVEELVRFHKPKARNKTVTCAAMRHADRNLEMIGCDKAPYCGCRITWKTNDRANGEHDGIGPNALAAQWCAQQKPGEQIGCIMGAFYTFTRAWYEVLGRPWKVGTGWGGDEELLSIASWIMGGEVRMLPERFEVAHVMGQDAHNPNRWQLALPDADALWLNRFRLPHLLPLSDSERAELLEHISLNGHTTLRNSWPILLASDLERPEVKMLQAQFAPHRHEWDVFRNRFVDMPAPTTSALATTAARIQAEASAGQPLQHISEPRMPQQILPNHPDDVCSLCDARNSFERYKTRGNRRYYHCKHCGRPAVRVGNGSYQTGAAVYE